MFSQPMKKGNILVVATTFPRWKNDTEPNFVFVLSRLLSGYGHKVTALAPHFHRAKKYEVIDKSFAMKEGFSET